MIRRIYLEDGPLRGKTVPCPGRRYICKVALSRFNKFHKVGWAWVCYKPRQEGDEWIGHLERVWNPEGIPLTIGGFKIQAKRPPRKPPKRIFVTFSISKKMFKEIRKRVPYAGVTVKEWCKQAIRMRLRQTPELR